MKKITIKEKITMLKNQVNNIDVVGKILTQESQLIAGFKKKNNLVTNQSWFAQRASLDKVQGSLKEVIEHFQGRAEAIEGQLKLLQLPIKETK